MGELSHILDADGECLGNSTDVSPDAERIVAY